jgi:L-lactate dehydrogenase complex protein LldG
MSTASSARAEILGRVKKAVKHGPRKNTPALIPARGLVTGAEGIQKFVDEAEYSLAEVLRLKNISDVVGQVQKIIAATTTQHLKAAPHKVLQDLDWGKINVKFGCGEDEDLVALSVAYAGVSETGTLVLRSGEDAPTTLNFLPDVHVVVLFEADIQGSYEDVWQRLQNDNDQLPRTVNWITGPSRTADIEQTMLLGAHGPRKLVILLIDG